MIHFNALGFSMCHYEEVMNLFWRSVYIFFKCPWNLLQEVNVYFTLNEQEWKGENTVGYSAWDVSLAGCMDDVCYANMKPTSKDKSEDK